MKKGFIIAAISIFILGVIALVLGVCLCGGKYEKLVAAENFENMTYEKSISEVPEINRAELNIDFGSVVIKKGDKLNIEYIENEKTTNTINITDGVLNFTQNRKSHVFSLGMNIPKDIVVTLPNDNIPLTLNIKNGEIKIDSGEYKELTLKTNNGRIVLSNSSFLDSKIETDNGVVDISNCTFGNLDLKSDNGKLEVQNSNMASVIADVDNGYIHMDSVKVENDAKLTTNNGAIKLEKLLAKNITAESDNGAIKLERVMANNYNLKTDNGVVKGSVVGKKEEYNIFVSHRHGNSNLSNSTGTTEKVMNLTTSNGSINITFVD